VAVSTHPRFSREDIHHGPAVDSKEGIRGLIEAGMDVARLNFSHGEHSAHGRAAELIRSESAALGKHVAILQDLCGPKIRTGKVGPTALGAGDSVDLVSGDTGDANTIAVDYEGLADDVRPDDRILLSDGQVELKVLGSEGGRVKARVEHGGPMRPRMGVNLPSGSLRLGATSQRSRPLAPTRSRARASSHLSRLSTSRRRI
jgi:pyruvate kinase